MALSSPPAAVPPAASGKPPSAGRESLLARIARAPALELGFRPLYLVAALFAAAAVPIWIAEWLGFRFGRAGIAPMAWHAHEMVFGFAAAVIVGFLFTAGRNWTNQPTPAGLPLAALVALWLAGRVLMLTGPHTVAAAVDVAFLPACAAALARALVQARNVRNYFFVALLGALTAVNVVFHLAVAGLLALEPARIVHAAIFVVVCIVAVMGGRVIPMFTRNGTRRLVATNRPTLDRIAIAVMVAAFTASVLDAPPFVLVPVALLAAIAHAARLAGWDSLATRRIPILWILHVSYAWIPAGFALMALAAVTDRVPSTLAVHAFALGAIGGMVMGMITRTARGHTGRPLVASRFEVLAYVLVHVAAATRVLAPLALPTAYAALVGVAGALWSIAFVLYAVLYAPILTQPRADAPARRGPYAESQAGTGQ